MSTLNNVVLVGRLTAAPELRRTNSGSSVTSFTIALDNPTGKDQDKTTSFIPVNCWNATAENVAKYCDKGDLIALEGRLNQRTYEDKDGNRRSIVEVVAQNIQFLTPKKNKEEPAEEEPEPPARTPAKNRAGYQQRR
jgi:single-strand DNA-binding protein